MHGWLGAKHHRNVERVFLYFCKEYHVKTVLGDDQGQRNREQIRKNRNEFIDRKMVPKLCQNGCKRASHATEIETLPLQAQAPEMLPI